MLPVRLFEAIDCPTTSSCVTGDCLKVREIHLAQGVPYYYDFGNIAQRREVRAVLFDNFVNWLLKCIQRRFRSAFRIGKHRAIAFSTFGVKFGPTIDFWIYDIPSQTERARPTRIIRVLPRRPNRLPIFSRGNVSTLSTIICDTRLRPFCRLGSRVMRNSGASIIVLVSGTTVILA